MSKPTISFYGNGQTLFITTGDQNLVDALALNYAQGKPLPLAVEGTSGFPAPPSDSYGI